MGQETGTEMQIADYFRQSASQRLNESEMIGALTKHIARKKETFSEKVLLAGLLEKLETESDAIKLQVYRQALEILLKRR
ncbi:biofilm development regulator YmgB/AriR family protein [Mixta intestinalis]|jgi:uncharacterized protein Yka (UPF0111/DUF47 family)|uniref:Putative two-component-system connector protein AriR n=1 Tax=Mixta intestinalis TaxID=1615494 RepID=A0A6P1PXZ2_9GAMM|nr:biofilm development regulator YmgB/AriR family protein [Mixta intestinalis]QHM70747.1 putative two-component-system connector protein AriR [Mixta intestinalis]